MTVQFAVFTTDPTVVTSVGSPRSRAMRNVRIQSAATTPEQPTCNLSHEPNAATMRVLDASLRGKNLTRVDTIEALFQLLDAE